MPISLKSLRLSALAIALGASPGLAQTDSFPTEPVELLVYTDPGTSIDQMLRALAPLLSDEFGQPVVVVNRPGGNGTNALAYLMRRPADGHTLFGQTTTFSSVMAQQVGGYTGEEVDFLCQMVSEPLAITVRDDSPFESVDEIVEYARANPGDLRLSGGAGAGSYAQLFGLAFQEESGVEWTWVPFGSSTEVIRALLGGDLDLSFSAVGSIEGGRMLAVTSADRFSFAPDVPTLTELGYDVGDLVAWRGVLVRAGVPEDRKQYLIDALSKAAARPEWKEFTDKLGAEQSLICGEEFATRVKNEIARTREYYRELGIVD